MSKPEPWRSYLAAAAALAGAVLLTTLIHWEPSGESWGYWHFARRLSHAFEAVTSDRSPLYTLWLQPFLALGYPNEILAEYCVSAWLAAAALCWLLAPRLGLTWATAISAGWLPFLQQAEPPVQRLAFAASVAGVALRRREGGRALAYALFAAAGMLRGPYWLFFAAFGAYDLRLWRRGEALRPVWWGWLPLAGLAVLFFAFRAQPSQHRWNNAWLCTTDWFPLKGKTLGETAILSGVNWSYIERRYGTPRDVDLYFTHQELFGDAVTLGAALRVNPQPILAHMLRNVKAFPSTVVSVFSPERFRRGIVPWLLVALLLVAVWRGSEGDPELRIMLGVGFVIAASVIPVWPQSRYYQGLAPALSVAGFWLGCRVRWLAGQRAAWGGAPGALAQAAVVFFFCGGVWWAGLAGQLASDAREGTVRLLSQDGMSMKAQAPRLIEAAAGCRGIISLEHNWFAAFLPEPAPESYDVFEVPPFRQAGGGAYDGLRPDRVDCVFVSDTLMKNLGWGTNYGLRWRLWIEPYERVLLGMGAERRELPGYGHVVLLRQPAR